MHELVIQVSLDLSYQVLSLMRHPLIITYVSHHNLSSSVSSHASHATPYVSHQTPHVSQDILWSGYGQ